MKDKNPFGGGNPGSLYVPMSEVEQEVLSRLVESGDLEVHVIGWGVVHKPKIIFGDLRLTLTFRLDFTAPEPPGIPLHFLDLELRTGTGLLLFKDRKSVEYGGKPVWVSAGVVLDFAWDIAIQAINPKVVKAIKPGATGLTSRLQDKDSGKITLEGNMKLTPQQKKLLRIVRQGEASSRRDDAARIAEVVKKAGGR